MTAQGMFLGLQPDALRVNLITGSDFLCTLRLNEAWPTGVTLSLVFPSTTWTATISGTDAVFNVDKAQADTITNDATVRLTYTNGATDQVWAIGTVVRRG